MTAATPRVPPPAAPGAVALVELLPVVRWTIALAWRTARGLLAWLVVLLGLRAAAPAGFVIVIRGLINAVAGQLEAQQPDLSMLAPWLIAGLVVTCIDIAAQFGSTYVTQRLTMELDLRVTDAILVHAASLDVAFFEDTSSRDALERARHATAAHVGQVLVSGLQTLTNLVQLVSLVAILVVIEPLVLAVLVPLSAPYLWFQLRLSRERFARKHVRATQRRWSQYFVSCLTGLPALAEVKLLGLAPLLLERFRTLARTFREDDSELQRRRFGGSTLFGIGATLALYAMFVRVVLRCLEGTLTLGDVAIFGGATSRARAAVQSAIHSATNAAESAMHVMTIREFLDVLPRSAGEPAHPEPPPARLRARGAITIDGVRFSYPGTTAPVLEGIDLSIRAGETLALVGENGAGKTTLANLLAGLYTPDAGRITLDGVDLRELGGEALRQEVSYVFQQFGRYEATAHENIAFGDHARLLGDREAVERMARLAGAHDMIAALPEGYDTLLGRMFGTVQLSGGQWQKIAVARAFARPAAVLILDEPTANLDARSEHRLHERFRELAAGRTAILISHRFSTVGMADRVAVLHEGRIVECGTHGELLEQGGRYATLFRLHHCQLQAPVGGAAAP